MSMYIVIRFTYKFHPQNIDKHHYFRWNTLLFNSLLRFHFNNTYTPFQKRTVTFRAYNWRLRQCKGQTSSTLLADVSRRRWRSLARKVGESLAFAVCTTAAVVRMGEKWSEFWTDYTIRQQNKNKSILL